MVGPGRINHGGPRNQQPGKCDPMQMNAYPHGAVKFPKLVFRARDTVTEIQLLDLVLQSASTAWCMQGVIPDSVVRCCIAGLEEYSRRLPCGRTGGIVAISPSVSPTQTSPEEGLTTITHGAWISGSEGRVLLVIGRPTKSHSLPACSV